MPHVHIHLHGRRTRDAGTAHDPKTGQFTQGTHVKITAPGTAGHGKEGHVINRPSAAGGRHIVRTPTGEDYHHSANELRATGKPSLPGRSATAGTPRYSKAGLFARARR